jgi:uncharacterized membrane protein YkvA (DUF1232 family)
MSLRSPLRLGLTVFSLWPFMPVAVRAPLYGRLLAELVRDQRVPVSRKLWLAVAAAYVASPIDLIPDFIPVISRLDDVAVVVVALDLFLESVPKEILIEKMYALGIDGRELERDMESVRRFVPKPIRAALMRLPEAVDAGVIFVRGWLTERWDQARP